MELNTGHKFSVSGPKKYRSGGACQRGTCGIMFPIAPKSAKLFVDRLEASSEFVQCNETKVTARKSIKKQKEGVIMLWRHGFSGKM